MPRTDFHPEEHGFAFINSWGFDDEERADIEAALVAATRLPGIIWRQPLLSFWGRRLYKQLQVWTKPLFVERHGLCGGMAYAALDYYRRPDIPFPRGEGRSNWPDHTTEGGGILRGYLRRRLLESLAANTPRFLLWMFMLHDIPVDAWPLRGGPSWLAKETAIEWKTLKRHIDTGDPWPLGLVGETRLPTENHQVLATGYEDPGDGTGVVYLYDMNCPGEEREIKLTLDEGGVKISQEDCVSSARGTIQGFFCEAYIPNPDPPLVNWP